MENPYQSQPSTNPQQPLQTPPKTDGFAITSMVLGIIAVITCYFGIILGTVAVIFGHLSIGKMKREPSLGGKGMAIAGLATGYVAIAISVVSGIMLFFAASEAKKSGQDLFGEMGQEFQKEFKKEMEKERQKQESSRELIPDQQ